MLMSLSYCGYKRLCRIWHSECSGYRRPKTQENLLCTVDPWESSVSRLPHLPPTQGSALPAPAMAPLACATPPHPAFSVGRSQ